MIPQRGIAALAQWSARRKAVLLIILATPVFLIPYWVPQQPTVSLSYITGFNNRACTMLFVLMAAVFLYLTDGKLADTDDEDGTLFVSALYWAMAAALLLCLIRIGFPSIRAPQWDGNYFVQRQQMLAAGLSPHTQFEFVYGPLLIYPGYWIAHLTGLPQAPAYYICWILQWLIGTAMMWAVVRAIDIPVCARWLLFCTLMLVQLNGIGMEGETYTPFRGYSAAFLIFAAHFFWKRYGSLWKLSIAASAAVALAICVSAEQAIGTTVGLGGFFCLLGYKRGIGAAWKPLLLFLAGVLLSFGTAAHAKIFTSVSGFAVGGMNFPMLPTPTNLLVLFAYLVAGSVLYRRIAEGHFESLAVPLALGGIAMLPSAFGRCDFYHVPYATPAFVVGVAGIFAMPTVRRWWLPLAYVFVWFLPATFAYRPQLKRAFFSVAPKKLWPERRKYLEFETGPLLSTQRHNSWLLPCDRTYYTPVALLPPAIKVLPQCLDTGYFRGLVDGVVTREAIGRKVDEMRQRPNDPLLLDTRSLEEQFALVETAPQMLVGLEITLPALTPRPRNKPLDYAPIISYIRDHYTPGPLVGKTGVRIWYPSHSSNPQP